MRLVKFHLYVCVYVCVRVCTIYSCAALKGEVNKVVYVLYVFYLRKYNMRIISKIR